MSALVNPAAPAPVNPSVAAAARPVPEPVPPRPIPAAVPVNFPDGTLLKASGPEVDIMQGHERRWIPDPDTFTYMGLNWGAVRVIADDVWNSIPAGPALPSRMNGTLLKGSGPPVYVMQNGMRHWIPDPATFAAMGYSWTNVQTVADADLTAIPLGNQVPEGGTAQPLFPIIASQDDGFPGSGGFMHTDVTLYASGLLNGVTHTWEVTDLRGFRGSVAVALLNQAREFLWVSGTHSFGVDGRWIGTSERYDNWSDNAPAAVLPLVSYIAIIQKPEPDVGGDIQHWLATVGQALQELETILQTVAKIAALL
jgi:hypothetical protein